MKISEFLEYAISKEVEYNDNFWENVENIISDTHSRRGFIEEYKLLEPRLNKDNIMAAIGLITDIVTSLEFNLPELYPTLLKWMYKPFSYNYSVCHRIAKLLINIKEGEKDGVFNDMVNLMNPLDITSIKISICALYSNFEFSDIKKSLVLKYLEKVCECFKLNKNDESLKRDINNFLLSKITDNDYSDFILKLT